MMPTLNVTFAEQSTNMTLLLDNNANFTYAWASNCKQNKPFDKTLSCTAAPTLLTLGYNVASMDTDLGDFSNFIQGGYTMSGSIIENNLTMYNTTTTAGSKTDFQIYFASRVSSDAWFYNTALSAQGALALGNNS